MKQLRLLSKQVINKTQMTMATINFENIPNCYQNRTKARRGLVDARIATAETIAF